jgi:hypothetical protein
MFLESTVLEDSEGVEEVFLVDAAALFLAGEREGG